MAEKKTKIDIFSGFLGAGKTTLIKKLIKEAFAGEQIVLIENEFGEIGIDGGFMREAGIQVNELNSGCICCSLVGDFREALKKVVETYHPDRILIDCLVMTASTNQRQAEQILRAMSLCKEHLGVKCALGVSNISFGLPARPLLGSVFLAAAFGAGLDAPIMNPGSKRFMDTVYSYRVLSAEDEGSTGYIERYAGWTDPYKIAANPAAAQAASTDAVPTVSATASADDDPIRHMVVSGRKGEIAAETERLLADHDAMDLINKHFIPALDEVGVLFDQGKFFLPQLMASAEAARVGFDTIKRLMPAGEIADKGKICVATVKGDIHDIGKNIVKMLLDNYGYTVFDLGRDVDPQEVLKTVQERDIKLVGLSALMTTTVVAMEETIKLLHAEVPGVKIIVGGAVLNPEYAKQIGADYYAKDAAESARIAEEVFGQ